MQATQYTLFPQKLVAWVATLLLLLTSAVFAFDAGFQHDTPTGTGDFTLSWQGAYANTPYYLQYSSDGIAWSTMAGNTGSATETGKGFGTHHYRIVEHSMVMTKGVLIPIHRTESIPHVVDIPVTVPTGFDIPVNSSIEITITWDTVVGADTYVLEQQIDDGAWVVVYSGSLLSWDIPVNAAPGTYSFRVRACSDAMCSANTVEQSVVFGSSAFDPATDVLEGDIYWGKLPETHKINKDGSFSYDIPIEVPPGINDLQPRLSFKYNSNFKNGALGWGWVLSGMQKIHRCPADLTRDGFIDGVNSEDSFKYCLNGSRLVEVSPLEYRTEVESYRKIVRHGSDPADPTHWTLTTREGLVHTFGNTDDSFRVDSADGKAEWYVSKETDLAGNYLTYSYTKNEVSGTHFVSSIAYTQNDLVQATDHSIEFIYDIRPDLIEKYQFGTQQNIDKRLVRVDVKVNGVRKYFYQIEYENFGASYYGSLNEDPVRVSKLSKIKRCRDIDIDCSVEKNFKWSKSDSSTFGVSAGINHHYYGPGDFDGDGDLDTLSIQGGDTKEVRVLPYPNDGSVTGDVWITTQKSKLGLRPQFFDMNGDGLDDVVFTDSNKSSNLYTSVRVLLSTGASFVSQVWADPYQELGHTARKAILDLNGDNLPDILAYNWGKSISVRINDGSGFGPWESWYSLVPTEWILVTNATLTPLRFADFNGDQLVDILACPTVASDLFKCSPKILLNTGSEFILQNNWVQGSRLKASLSIDDVNGDGNADLLSISNVGVTVELSTGSDFAAGVIWSDQITQTNNSGEFYDGRGIDVRRIGLTHLNDDNCADLVVHGQKPYPQYNSLKGIHVALSMCNSVGGFAPFSEWVSTDVTNWYTQPEDYQFIDPGSYAGSISPLYAKDLNGDGIRDLSDDNFDRINKINRKLLESVYDGSDLSVDVSYGSITNADFYSNEDALSGESLNVPGGNMQFTSGSLLGNFSGVPSPVQSSSPVNVVKSIQIDDGIGGVNQFSYEYKSYKYHLNGWGDLGFSQIDTITQAQATGGVPRYIRTKSNYSQEYIDDSAAKYNLAGRLLSETRELLGSLDDSSPTLLSDRTLNWQVLDYNGSVPHYSTYKVSEFTQRYDKEYSFEPVATEIMQLVAEPSLQASCVLPVSVSANNRVITSDIHLHSSGVPFNIVEANCDAYGTAGSSTLNSSIVDIGNVQGLVKNKVTTQWNSAVSGAQVLEMDFTYDQVGRVDTVTRQPNAGADEKLTTSYTYNGYGSVASITEAWVNTPNNGMAVTTRTRSLTESYTSSVKEVTYINELGQVSSVKYDARFGKEKNATDINGLTTTTDYDAVGRPILITNPDLSTTRFDYRVCDGCSFAVNYNNTAEWYVQQKTMGESSVRNYFDSKGRELGGRNRGLLGEHTYTFNEYDRFGRLITTSLPHRSGIRNVFDTRYDELSRVIATDNPTGYTETIVYSAVPANSHAIEKAINTNTLLQTKTRTFDAEGREKSVVDALGTVASYDYDGLGNLASVTVDTGAEGQVSYSISHDVLGRKTQLVDPDIGTVTYKYNALDLHYEKVNEGGQITRYEYDKLARVTRRIDNATGGAQSHSWIYDTAPGAASVAKGLPASVIGVDTEGRAYREDYEYDALARLAVTDVTLNGISYTSELIYDEFGREAGYRYPSGFATFNRYNAYGHIDAIENAFDDTVYWQADADDAFGNVTRFNHGNGVVTNKTFDPVTGLMATVTATKNGTSIVDHEYSFDSEGNLSYRRDLLNSRTEHFCYDDLSRLTEFAVGGDCYGGKTISYYANGNIKHRSDVFGGATYIYGENGAGPHAVTSIGSNSYSYDENGQMNSGGGRSGITYTTYGKPKYVQRGVYSTNVIYGTNKNRMQRVDVGPTGTETTTYIAGVYEKVESASKTLQRHYIGDSVIYIQDSSAADRMTYMHHDHIGSLVAKTDGSGSVLEQLGSEPWGQQVDQWGGVVKAPDYNPEETDRGFTGHEHMSGVGLIHMNGRVYDPLIGRFLSPDVFIQQPNNAQSYNRYSYVWNNPLSNTDPTGAICIPCATGIIGGTGAALGSIAAGNDIFSVETLSAFGAGALVGSGLAFVSAPVGAVGTAVIGTTGAVATDSLTQVGLIASGNQESFDFRRAGVTFAGGLASSILPSAVAGTSAIRSSFSLTETILFETNATAVGFATSNLFDSTSNVLGFSNDFGNSSTSFTTSDFSNFGQSFDSSFGADFNFNNNFGFDNSTNFDFGSSFDFGTDFNFDFGVDSGDSFGDFDIDL